MMTQKEFAQAILHKTLGEVRNPTPEELRNSSSVAVAAEFLDMIESEEDREYARSRGGIFCLHANDGDPRVLTVRDLLGLLPGTMEELHETPADLGITSDL